MLSDPETFVFGDIVLVPFPFTDQSGTKRRPAVVIGAAAPDRRPDIILMPITSQLRGQAGSGDLVVVGWHAAGLLKPSAVKPVIATIETSLVLRRLGALDADDLAALRGTIDDLIGR